MRDQKLMKRVKFGCHSSERRLHHNKTVVRILDTAESFSWEGFFSGKGLGGLWVDRGLGKMVGQLIGQGDVSVGIKCEVITLSYPCSEAIHEGGF